MKIETTQFLLLNTMITTSMSAHTLTTPIRVGGETLATEESRDESQTQRRPLIQLLLILFGGLMVLQRSRLLVSGELTWQDGSMLTAPNFLCSSSKYVGDGSVRMMQSSHNTSEWFLTCAQDRSQGSNALLYYGTLNEPTLIYNQTNNESYIFISAIAQFDATSDSVSKSTNSVYLLTTGFFDFMIEINTRTFVTTQIQLPFLDGWWRWQYTAAPFTLIPIDQDGLILQVANEPTTLLLYNTTTTNWTVIPLLATGYEDTLCAITYTIQGDELIIGCQRAGIYLYRRNMTTGLFIDGSLHTLMPPPLFHLSPCVSSTGYFIRNSAFLFGICSNTIRVWNLIDNINGSTTVSSANGTLLYDANEQSNFCAFLPLTPEYSFQPTTQTFLWYPVTQTLYVGCSSGSASALSIQSIHSAAPVITSLISTDICSQITSPIIIERPTTANGGINMTFLNVSHQSITLFLPCIEGIFLTSGRSLNTVGHITGTVARMIPDPASNSFYLASTQSPKTTQQSALPSLYQLHDDLIPLLNFSVCSPQSFTYNPDTRTFYLICTSDVFDFDTFTTVRMKNDSSNEIAEITRPFTLPDTFFSLIYWTRWGVYFLYQNWTFTNNTGSFQAIIEQWSEGDTTPAVVSLPPSMLLLHLRGAFFSVTELSNHNLLVGLLCDTATTSNYSIWLISDMSNATNWSQGRLIYSTTERSVYGLMNLQVTQDGTQVWFLLGANELHMVEIDESLPNNYSWVLQDVNSPAANISITAFALDSMRGRVFVAWFSDDQSNDEGSRLSVFDMLTERFTETASPASYITPFIFHIAVDQLTGTLIAITQGKSDSEQIVVYSDQWTCSAGMEWIDGSCQPCNLATSRGFISYENAIRSSPQCESCRVGRFSNRTGVSECRLCDPGRYSSSRGSIICEYCQLNQYNNMSGWNSTCSLCSSGSQSFIAGATICSSCTLGQANEPGQSCQTCPINTYSPSLGAACLTCTDENQEGLQCLNGLANVNEGWWAYQLNVNGSFKFVTTQCPPSYCPGSALQNPNTTLCQYPRLNSRDNWLCANCVEGHIAWGSSCEPCTRANVGLLIGILIFAILLVFFLLRSSSAAGPLTILVFFVQVAAIEVGPVSHWIDWIQFVNFGAASTRSCIVPIMPITQNIITMFVPLMLFVILALLCCINYILSRYFSSRDMMSQQSTRCLIRSLIGLTRDFSIDRYIGCMMAILIFCYSSVTVTCVQSLHCISVAPGIDRLFSAPTIDCNSHEYKTHLLPVAIVFLILYVIGFPLTMFVFLWRSSSTLRQVTVGQLDNSFSNPTFQQFAARWSHFYRPYRCEVWYWQPVAMFRRFLFSLASVLLIESPTSKYVMYSSIGLLSLTLHSILRPFVTSRWNHFESASYLLLIYVAYLLTGASPPFSIGIQVALFFLIVPFSLFLVGLTVRMIWMNLKSKLPRRSLNSPAAGVGAESHDEYTPLSISSASHRLLDPYEEN